MCFCTGCTLIVLDQTTFSLQAVHAKNENKKKDKLKFN